MNKEIKTQWIAALRSKQYKQGYNSLRNEKDEYCCLGVLADIYVKDKNLKWTIESFRYAILGQGATLPSKICEWSEIKSCVGQYSDGSLARDNDFNHLSFEEISNIIEEKF